MKDKEQPPGSMRFDVNVARVGLAVIRVVIGLALIWGVSWLWPFVKPWLHAITA